jgi:hypothetical protein
VLGYTNHNSYNTRVILTTFLYWKVGDVEESEVECKSTLGDGDTAVECKSTLGDGDTEVECKNTLGDGEGVIAEKCGEGVIAEKSRVLLLVDDNSVVGIVAGISV